ncbi:MAG: hypothetical protein QOE75_1842 [Solirubrobacterales bacterium]|nr:hypothetical protein [Solirubrobacterales bacterium]
MRFLACEQPLRIGLIASATQTVEEPFAGGMEAHTAALASSLRSRGHEVTIHAASSARPRHQAALAAAGPLRISASARRDVSMPAEAFMAEHHAYLSLMLGLDELGHDVVHNNCLHYQLGSSIRGGHQPRWPGRRWSGSRATPSPGIPMWRT